MKQTKIIKVSTVRKSTLPTVGKADLNDIDIVVNMVNEAACEREAAWKVQAQRERIRLLKIRERDVARRERIVRRREAQYQSKNAIVNAVVDASLIGVSIVSLITAMSFILML